jgi:hypothetical protein
MKTPFDARPNAAVGPSVVLDSHAMRYVIFNRHQAVEMYKELTPEVSTGID